MKTIITTLPLYFLVCMVATAQMDRNHKTTLSSNEVPLSVRESQQINFPNTFVTRWYRYSNLPQPAKQDIFYTSRYKNQGSNSFKAYFDRQGNVIARMTFLTAYSIPESIQQKIMESNRAGKIKSGELIELYDRDMMIYRVKINTDGLLEYLYYDKYARMLNPSRLPVEVMSLN